MEFTNKVAERNVLEINVVVCMSKVPQMADIKQAAEQQYMSIDINQFPSSIVIIKKKLEVTLNCYPFVHQNGKK